MEDVLVPYKKNSFQRTRSVLILVVVEDVLVQMVMSSLMKLTVSLNPCCSGRCSSTSSKSEWSMGSDGLNPCCSGRCSSTRWS